MYLQWSLWDIGLASIKSTMEKRWPSPTRTRLWMLRDFENVLNGWFFFFSLVHFYLRCASLLLSFLVSEQSLIDRINLNNHWLFHLNFEEQFRVKYQRRSNILNFQNFSYNIICFKKCNIKSTLSIFLSKLFWLI